MDLVPGYSTFSFRVKWLLETIPDHRVGFFRQRNYKLDSSEEKIFIPFMSLNEDFFTGSSVIVSGFLAYIRRMTPVGSIPFFLHRLAGKKPSPSLDCERSPIRTSDFLSIEGSVSKAIPQRFSILVFTAKGKVFS